MGDKELIEAARHGDEVAFSSLIETYYARLYRAACCLTRSAPDAEDLAQETSVRACRALGRFRGDCSFYTWLFSILLNLYRRWLRHQRRRQRWHTGAKHPEAADPAPSPRRRLAAQDDLERVLRLIDELPPKLREILVLRHVEEMSNDEIARAVGCRPGTVGSRLHRARQLLAARCRRSRGSDEKIPYRSFAEQGGMSR